MDAKKTSIDIFTSKEAAFQVRSYGWSAGLPCSFLTNFEQFVIFDCRYTPQKSDAANMGAIQITMDNYMDRFDEINKHLNRILIYQNNLQKLYNAKKLDGTETVDLHFNRFLSKFRIILAKNLYENNKSFLNEEDLNYYVQIILDRIIFIRVCESKSIEKEGLLLDFLEKGFWKHFKKSCYVEFYNHYDGAMFSKDSSNKFPNLIVSDTIFNDFIKQLYYPYPYQFNVIPTKIIAKVYEDFLAYSLSINNDGVIPILKEEYIKTNGAIPTHEFIADAICKETFSSSTLNSIDDIFSLRILDPCCGSGVFLISSYDYLAKKLMFITHTTNEWCIVSENTKYLTVKAKQRIMSECLFGIDCDPTAVEVTKMSLALKVVDDITPVFLSEIGIFGDKILSNIHRNIIIGNTLVDTDIDCPLSAIKYIRPINIHNQVYKKVFEEKNGFDYIVGNPPYVETKYFKSASPLVHNYLHSKYSTFEGKVDLSVLFIERGIGLLNSNGILGMIIQRRWFKTNYGKSTRNFITDGSYLYKLLDIETNSLFKGRTTYVSIIILRKRGTSKVYYDIVHGDSSDVQAYFEANKLLPIIDSHYFSSSIWAPELKNIFEIKNKYAEKYGTIGSNVNLSICDGIQALWKKIYDVTDYSISNGIITGKNGFGETVSIEKDMVKPIIYNREFKSLKKLCPDAYRIFPYYGTNNKTKMTINYIHLHYPLAYNYLATNELRIKNKVRCNDGEYWPTYTREHNHDSFDSFKIIIPMTAKETYASLETKTGFYMDNSNVWFIKHHNNDIIVMKALTMIINSTVFSVMAKCGANQASNGYYKFNKQFIEPVPLPNNKLLAENEIIICLSKLYDEIVITLNEYENASQNDAVIFQGVLEQKWLDVDNLCFKFYELEENEISSISRLGRLESRIPGGN